MADGRWKMEDGRPKKIGNDGNRLKTDGNRGMNRRLLSNVARVSMIWVRTFYLDLV